MLNILVLEDNELARLSLEALLRNRGKLFEFSKAQTLLDRVDELNFDIAFIDLDLEEELAGLEVIELLSSKGTYCVCLSGREDGLSIQSAYELGAKDFVLKPAEEDIINSVFERYNIERSLVDDYALENINLDTNLIDHFRGYSFTKPPVLLTGETGTGKTVMAKKLYDLFRVMQDKSVKEFPFVQVSCNEINENLVESELFGHKKGAYTGAHEEKLGKLFEAHGGVLFLDEIASIPISVQNKLLKVIEEKRVTPLGSNESTAIDFILITATCEPLKSLVDSGKFREDLYERIKGVDIELLSFREQSIEKRKRIIKEVSSEQKRKVVITPSALEELISLPWFGNLRGIRHFFEKTQAKGIGIIDSAYIEKTFTGIDSTGFSSNVIIDSLISKVEEIGFNETIEEIEGHLIYHFYKKNNFKTRQTIKELGISNSQFYRRMKLKENS